MMNGWLLLLRTFLSCPLHHCSGQNRSHEIVLVIMTKASEIKRLLVQRGYSSVVEHSTADREVTGSNPVAPFDFLQTFF